MPDPRAYGMDCENCSGSFDPISYRWKCPHCGWKADCCTGMPLPPRRSKKDMNREGDQKARSMMLGLM